MNPPVEAVEGSHGGGPADHGGSKAGGAVEGSAGGGSNAGGAAAEGGSTAIAGPPGGGDPREDTGGGGERRPAVDRRVAGVTLAYLVVATFGWYALRSRGLAHEWTVVAAYALGVAVFFGAWWAFRGVAPWRLGREAVVVTVSALVFLTLFWFYGRRSSYSFWFGADPPWGGLRGLLPYFFFVGCSVLARVILPIVTGRVVLGRGPGDYGWRFGGTLRLSWIYLALFLLVVPAVIYASTLPSFLQKYPWCKQAVEDGRLHAGVFAVYTAAAFVFYASGEAFWRGWMLFGTERALGDTALFLMLVPYVIGHYGKPMPETFGAVASGLVLGYLALRHRSFWLGAVTHWAVAMTMDLAALWRKGVEFTI